MVVAARRKAEFEAQLARVCHFDEDVVGQAARKAAEQAPRQANKQAAAQCRRLGIPRPFAPESADASAFLEAKATPAQLMPVVTVEEIQKQLALEDRRNDAEEE